MPFDASPPAPSSPLPAGTALLDHDGRCRQADTALAHLLGEVPPGATLPLGGQGAARLADALARLRREPRDTAEFETDGPAGIALHIGLSRLGDGSVVARVQPADATDMDALFFMLSADLLAVVGADGRLQRVNPMWQAVLGWDAATLCAHPFLDFVHPADREATCAEAEAVATGNAQDGFRNRWRTRDGDHRWLEWRSCAGRDGRLYCVARDVTAQQARLEAQADAAQRSADALADAQRRLALHAGNSPLAMIEWDREGRVQRWSARAVELFGWREADVLGKSPADWRFVHNDDAVSVTRIMAGLMSGRQPRGVCRNRNYTRAGEVVHCEWFNSAVYDEHGALVSILSQVQDTTEHELAQVALRTSEERFRATFEQAAVGMAHVDLDGHWLRANSALCRLLGHTPAALLGQPFQTLSHPDDLPRDLAQRARLIAGEINAYSLEKRYRRADGEWLWALLTVSLMRDALGRPLKIIKVVEDIGARKAAEAALQRAHDELEQRVVERTAELEAANVDLSREIAQRAAAQAALHDSELRLRRILDRSHDAFVAIDEHGRVVEWNPAAHATFGWTRDEAVGRLMGELIIPRTLRRAHADGMAKYLASGAHRVLDQRLQLTAMHRDGREFPVELTISEVRHGPRRLFTAFLHDIGERLEAERRLQASETRMRLIADHVPALIAYVDADLRFRFNNAAYRQWLGVDPDALAGAPLAAGFGEALAGELAPHFERALAGERVVFERALPCRDGPLRHVSAVCVPDLDEEGRVRGVHATFKDVTAHVQLAQVLEKRALRDELTGLPNRAALMQHLDLALARAQRHGSPVVAMFLDLNGFKQVNDRLGHEAGDAVLREFARRLAASVRKSDIVARLAGDEFVVVLDQVADAVADPDAVARKILAAMAPPMAVCDEALPLAASIGVAVQRIGPFDRDGLLRAADAAMYRAKRDGASCFERVDLDAA